MRKLTQRHNKQHNDQKVTLMSNGIADKNNNQTYIHKGLWASKLAAREVLHGEQNLNSSQHVWHVGIQLELILA